MEQQILSVFNQSYDRTVWEDRVVERPSTFNERINEDGSFTLEKANGLIVREGTPISAKHLNNMEIGIENLYRIYPLLYSTMQSIATELAILSGSITIAGIHSNIFITDWDSLKINAGYVNKAEGRVYC